MRRSAREIEEGIRRKLSLVELPARGMWHEMRYLIETESDRPGHLQQNGRPISDGQLALRAGCPSEIASQLLRDLGTVGLLEISGERIGMRRC